jgi:predicted methyltransferase
MNRQTVFTITGLALSLLGMTCDVQAGETEDAIDQALVAAHRPATNKARDMYRHPKETLLFFGVAPDQTLVEMTPGMGWYTEILAPLLREKGRYYAAVNAVTEKTPEALRDVDRNFRKDLLGRPDLYDRVTLSVSTPPNAFLFAPASSVDRVLTFRNVHNWARAGTTDAIFKAFYDALKPGGILGVVEHRAKEGTSAEQMIKTGYMTEAYVMDAATRAGFQFVGKSEINANPRDTKDHPEGVWTLPPTLRMGEKDKEKYLAIGESDRMTLKFVKP